MTAVGGAALATHAAALMRDTHACLHCAQPLGAGPIGDFCCSGCQAVYDALRGADLGRYYELRGEAGEPVGDAPSELLDPGFVDRLEQSLAQATAPKQITLSVQGARCAACVWVLEQLFARLPGALSLSVSVSAGRLQLLVAPEFPIRSYLQHASAVGYRIGPRSAQGAPASDDLLLRLGVCTALALNAMAFSAALHLGVEAGPLRTLLSDLSFGAAMLAALIGGPVFFGAALRSLRARVLHLDLPIALGIALTALAATWAYFGQHAGAAYYDSLAAFVALMLAGRYVQERTVARSRAQLLDDPGIGSLTCRREQGERLELASCASIVAGDVLLVPSSELLPVRGELLSDAANCSLAWIDGESEPRAFARGDQLPSGAFNVGGQALRVRALEPFASSELQTLLRPSSTVAAVSAHLSRFSAWYVLSVLVLATGAFAAYALVTGDIPRALAVATAICVVTCPCAIGIAIPLAYDLTHLQLRKRGVFVREGGFLDRARDVQQIVFDKTGTLTTGRLHVVEPAVLYSLSANDREALFQLCARSVHPKSIALRNALESMSPRYRAEVVVLERPGLGVEASIDGRCYRLGRGSFAAPTSAPDTALCFAVDGQLLATIDTAETFRADAARETEALRAAGYEVSILSGDAQERVLRAAQALGIDPARAHGECSPADKAAWIATHGRECTLMVGDGVNDALAMQAAHCAATPAIDRPFLPARTDFYFTSPGLAAIHTALTAAGSVATVVRDNLRFAVAYNVIAVSAALAGLMQPWLAAIVMPLSSIVTVTRTTWALQHRSRAWKS